MKHIKASYTGKKFKFNGREVSLLTIESYARDRKHPEQQDAKSFLKKNKKEVDTYKKVLTTLSDVTDTLKSRSFKQTDESLEELAGKLADLRRDPKTKYYSKIIDDMLNKVERRYSFGKKLKTVYERVWKNRKRADQIRTASEMLNNIKSEIQNLKKDL